MTDVHCHVSCGDPSVREFLIGRDFVGIHPWDAESADLEGCLSSFRAALESHSAIGIGEIGLDRLHSREISEKQRMVFESQLALAGDFGCPVVLHGAKCWGQVVKAVEALPRRPSSFLCHGFSRSDGLLPDIERLGGFVSVGPAVLNDHAVNYRELVKRIPASILLLETDRTEAGASCDIAAVLAKTAALRGVTPEALESLTDANAERFISGMWQGRPRPCENQPRFGK